MHNVYSAAKPIGFYLDTAYVTIGSGIHRQVLPAVGLYIKTHVIVTGPQFAKIAGKPHGYIKRVAEVSLGITGGRKDLSNQTGAVQ
jgi:hypothetical protein